MKRLAALLLACACSGPAQETRPPPPAPKAAPPPAPAPTGPQPMSHEKFKDFTHAMDIEAGDEAKLQLVESALGHNWISSAEAGVIIDHVVHRENKLRVVPLIKDRILDKENAFWLADHFTYKEDKAKVRELLGQ
jgi:hypothetical protein